MIVCIEWRSVLFCLCALCVAHMLFVYHAVYVVYLCACVHVWYVGVLVLYVYLSTCMYVCLSMYVRWYICVYSVWMCEGYVFCVCGALVWYTFMCRCEGCFYCEDFLEIVTLVMVRGPSCG